jgi:uncharacterized protein involved in exopolysaccharide biosynthesis
MAETKETGKQQFMVRKGLRMVFRHRGVFVLCASIFSLVALFAIPSLPQCEKEYTGTAIFQRQQEVTLTDSISSFDRYKDVLHHELAGRNAIRDVITREEADGGLALDRGLPRGSDGNLTPDGERQLQAMVKEFLQQVRIGWEVREDQVDLVSVSFTHANPKLAEAVPNKLVTNYINRVSKRIVEDLKGSCDFLRDRVDEVQTRLTQASKDAIAFEKDNAGALFDNPGELEEQSRKTSSDLDVLRFQYGVAKQKLERLKAMAEKVKANPDEPVQVIKGPNPELERLKKELEDREKNLQGLQDALQDLRIVNRMTEEHPQVKALKAKMETAEEKVAETGKEIEALDEEVVVQRVFSSKEQREDLDVALAAAESEVEMAEKEIERLEQRHKGYENLLARYAPIREEWLRISQLNRDLAQEKQSWEKRLREVEMSLAAEVAKRRNRLAHVQLAEEQHKPSSPTLFRLLAFALVGGFAFGGAIVFLLHQNDRTVWTPRDAEGDFGLPVCGTIGEIVPQTWEKRLWQRARFPLELLVLFVLVGAVGVGSLHVTLWLEHPEHYTQWTETPLAFLGDQGAEILKGLRQQL